MSAEVNTNPTSSNASDRTAITSLKPRGKKLYPNVKKKEINLKKNSLRKRAPAHSQKKKGTIKVDVF